MVDLCEAWRMKLQPGHLQFQAIVETQLLSRTLAVARGTSRDRDKCRRSLAGRVAARQEAWTGNHSSKPVRHETILQSNVCGFTVHWVAELFVADLD